MVFYINSLPCFDIRFVGLTDAVHMGPNHDRPHTHTNSLLRPTLIIRTMLFQTFTSCLKDSAEHIKPPQNALNVPISSRDASSGITLNSNKIFTIIQIQLNSLLRLYLSYLKTELCLIRFGTSSERKDLSLRHLDIDVTPSDGLSC